MALIRLTESDQLCRRTELIGDWGSLESSVSGQQIDGCVITTPEESSLDWDFVVGRHLRKYEVSIES